MNSSPPAQDAGKDARTVSCHCIIGHPKKAKFMVVRHESGWEPPTLELPGDKMVDFLPSFITHGVLQKYGLRATVLKIWLTTPEYSCVELEVHGMGNFNMQAVWADLDAYTQTLQARSVKHDPFVAWLRERASGRIPEKRAPWERKRWLSKAGAWVHDQLRNLRLEPPVGIVQFKAGLQRSCVLLVRCKEADLWLKAAYQRPPGEARLTTVLCRKWPDIVTPPLAVDVERNWLLMPDYRQEDADRPAPKMYPEFAAVLGRLQFEAISFADEWQTLDCPDLSLAALTDSHGLCERLYELVEPVLSQGINPLDQAERLELKRGIDTLRQGCGRLAEFGIPDTLTHLDFRADNFYLRDGHCRILDWADVAVTHPFFAMAYTLHLYRTAAGPDLDFRNAKVIDEGLVRGMRDRYLAEFTALLPMRRLEEALNLACGVFPLFDFVNGASELELFEPGGQQQLNLLHSLRRRARSLINAARRYQSGES